MERLTQRLRTGEVLMASEYEEKYTEQEWISVLQDRLADYEDTGLEPEQCENAKVIIESAFSDDTSKKETIDAITPDGFYLGDPADDCFTPDSEIGKTVFLTSEEAEAAFKDAVEHPFENLWKWVERKLRWAE